MPVPDDAHVPAGAEVWRRSDGNLFLVYDVPGSQQGAKMVWWASPSNAEVEALFGTVNPDEVQADREVDETEFHRETAGGAFIFGKSTELANTSEHPFEGVLTDLEKRAEVEPWLKDPEVLAVTMAARLEGRQPTVAEIKTTGWWQERTPAERQWVATAAGDPAAARRTLEDNRRAVGEQLRQAGVDNAPQELIRTLADKATKGQWSEGQLAEQIRKLSDPAAPGELHPDVQEIVQGADLDTTQQRVEDVRGLAGEWLGPQFGDWSDEKLNKWAGVLRNDPDGETKLMDHLRGARLRLFDNWEDPNLTYEDIAQIARGQFRQVWGESPDETSELFHDVANTKQHTEAAAMLRKEGVRRGVDKVVNDGLVAAGQAFTGGVNVRRAV